MYKRVLISVGTAVVLILVAACGFMLGNRVKVQTQDTENGQSAYMSSEQENAEAAASEGNEETTASDGNTAQANPGGDSVQMNSDGEVQSVLGDSASSGTGDIAESGSGDEASGQGDESQSVSGEAGVSSDISLHADSSVNADNASTVNGFQAASGDFEYIIYAEDGTLVVYYSDAATVYFDSGIEVQHLPEETRNQVEQGITFQSEEELFGFLESYSS